MQAAEKLYLFAEKHDIALELAVELMIMAFDEEEFMKTEYAARIKKPMTIDELVAWAENNNKEKEAKRVVVRQRKRSPKVGTRKSKYPWNLWLNGKPHVLVKNRDFKVKMHGFQSTVHGAAARRGLIVTTKVSGNKITIQAKKG